MFWKRPSFWTTFVTLVAYGVDVETLYGSFAYDDAGSVSRNVVVNGQVPWTQVWQRDFWGTSLQEPASHKSFRPITTLSFRLNWLLASHESNPNGVDSTLGFHLVNLALHGCVVALTTEAAAFVFDGGSTGDVIAQMITGLLFGLHPVHAEAVSNITSRGELFMSLFMLLAFVTYANQVCCSRQLQDTSKRKAKERETSREKNPLQPIGASSQNTPCQTHTLQNKIKAVFSIYVIPWICMTLSLFSKEQGATTLITLVAYDCIHNIGSVQQFFVRFVRKDQRPELLALLRRATVLAVQTLLMCVLRMHLNGESSPDFITDQNPAGFAKDRFVRVFSVNWVYCLYVWDAIFPTKLCCDWSGSSIPLVESIHDIRVLGVLALWFFIALVCYLLVFPSKSMIRPESRRVVLLAFFSFLASPFLLSSNLLVVVGLMKADRVLYLPLLGFCMLEALMFKVFICSENENAKASNEPCTERASGGKKNGRYWLGCMLIMIQLTWFSRILHERNLAWSSNINLWISAYEVNPQSHHTMYNCGYELSLKGRYLEAERVMRPIGSARVAGPSNSFVYAMALFNLNRKREARDIVDEALEVIEEQREPQGDDESNKRFRPDLLSRTESNLLVAKALTMDDIRETGQWMYLAVEKDPRNEYAVQQAQATMAKLKALSIL